MTRLTDRIFPIFTGELVAAVEEIFGGDWLLAPATTPVWRCDRFWLRLRLSTKSSKIGVSVFGVFGEPQTVLSRCKVLGFYPSDRRRGGLGGMLEWIESFKLLKIGGLCRHGCPSLGILVENPISQQLITFDDSVVHFPPDLFAFLFGWGNRSKRSLDSLLKASRAATYSCKRHFADAR